MALRVLQIYVPASKDGQLDELLEGRDILGRWRDSDAGQIVLHLLVPAEETEPIMDRFEQQFADTKGFHVILFPVEAVLPRLKSKAEETNEAARTAETESQQRELPRISREELYEEVNEGLGVSRVYVGMTVLSAVVAAVGILRDDVAVIIAAMVIAPLLGPNVAMALGTTLGDFELIRRAFVTNVVGVFTAFTFAVMVGVVLDVDPAIHAISSRTNVDMGDILLALAAGSAGTLAFTRGLSGAVIGVMVAVALVPPLVVCGMLLGEGYVVAALGAFLLTTANVICVNLAGVATFLLQGVRPRSWWEAERAQKATRRAITAWIVLLAVLVLILWQNQ